ncbi:MAG TPA: 23S rRNA (adenine(2030)-N(6))-methyltransferase RlmJ, partial [Nevskiaceae bacterium]|nr:23S rRNA (adenine(2030)-N(6))-methyltransferase RlmJ [Nevskiaceae bacterium]
EDAATLGALFAGDHQVRVIALDGWLAIGAQLPPKEKRGLVLVDPPFEARDEFARVRELLEKSLARFAGGIYAVWYPLKNRHEADRFVRALAALDREALDIRFDNGAQREGQMRECGMAIVHPPYQLEQALAPALAYLARALAQGGGAHYVMRRAAA